MASNTSAGRDPQAEHDELLAALAAARELGPDMDKSLAESYLQKRQQAQAKASVPAPQPSTSGAVATTSASPLLYLLPALCIAAYIVALVVSQGHLWWLFWLIPAFGGWGWWGRHEQRNDRRAQRAEWRRSRYGYPYIRYGSDQPQIPAQQPPMEAPQPQPRPQPPTEYD
ncbi:MAG: hypothetical protein ACHQ4H_10885 [Ktedonobacterales bacterium]